VGHEKHYLNKGAGSRQKTGTFVFSYKKTGTYVWGPPTASVGGRRLKVPVLGLEPAPFSDTGFRCRFYLKTGTYLNIKVPVFEYVACRGGRMGGEGIIGVGFWCAGTYNGDIYLPFLVVI
jgi:hypothetical protein